MLSVLLKYLVECMILHLLQMIMIPNLKGKLVRVFVRFFSRWLKIPQYPVYSFVLVSVRSYTVYLKP